jgi:hypothetical protein
MKKLWTAGAFVLAMAVASSALAQDVAVSTATPAGGFKPFVVGGMMSMGMANIIGEANDTQDAKVRFAGGGSAYFDWYLMDMLALEGGLGFVGKGCRSGDGDDKTKLMLTYFEITLGAKLNIHNFRAGLFLVPAFGLSGKFKNDDNSADYKWDDMETRRANLGVKVGFGYAIPVGPIAIVPGLDWSMHLINDQKEGDSARAMNIMINAAVEWGFGSK